MDVQSSLSYYKFFLWLVKASQLEIKPWPGHQQSVLKNLLPFRSTLVHPRFLVELVLLDH